MHLVNTGWQKFSTWNHSSTVRELYRKRCRREAIEMTSHHQAVELLAPLLTVGDTLLDVGCGSGYFYHSLSDKNLPVEYWGIDAEECLVSIGREEMPAFGLPAERLNHLRIEDADGEFDHVVCINVLTNIDNYHRPLDRMLRMAQKTLILRESISDTSEYLFVVDEYLDDKIPLKVHVNTYKRDDIISFIQGYGFCVREVVDEWTGGKPENVIGYPHYWTFLVAEKIA